MTPQTQQHATTLPANASLMAHDGVWIESEAVDQLARVANEPGCLKAVGMPDLHPGRGIPIGASFLFDDRVIPSLVGGDAGCGVLALIGHRDGPRGDALERRVLAAIERPPLPDVEPVELLECAWHRGPRGLADLAGVPESLIEVALRAPVDVGESGDLPLDRRFADQLGTVGGGNHFAEVSRIDAVVEKARASELGLRADAQVIVVHSGSRGLGAAIAERYAGQNLNQRDAGQYFADLLGAIRYARTNRLLVAWQLTSAAGLGSSARIGRVFDIVHNTVERTGSSCLHRKGAAPAELGQTTIVLGSRGAPSWLMEGLGNTQCLCSIAHGAGRRMGRAEAHEKLRTKYTRASLTRTALGSKVVADDHRLMYEEHPDAYKPIEPVIESIELAGAAFRLASLVPLITIKKSASS